MVCAVRNVVGGALHLGQSEDLGLGGITVRRPRDLPVAPETAVTLTFDLPGTQTTLDIDGQVVSDRRAGSFRRTGIRFVRLSSDLIALLGDFCRRRRSGASRVDGTSGRVRLAR